MRWCDRILFGLAAVAMAAVPLPGVTQTQSGAPPSMARMSPEEMRAEMETMISIQRQLRTIEQSIKLLEAQNRLNELQRINEMNQMQLDQARAGRQREETSRQLSEEQKRVASEAVRATVVPRVFAVLGSGESRRAFVLVPFFGEQSVKVGDLIVGDRYKVEVIDDTGVLVRDLLRGDNATIRLPFGSQVPALPPFQVDLPPSSTAITAPSQASLPSSFQSPSMPSPR